MTHPRAQHAWLAAGPHAARAHAHAARELFRLARRAPAQRQRRPRGACSVGIEAERARLPVVLLFAGAGGFARHHAARGRPVGQPA